MKKIAKISLLLVVLCLSVSVYADGDMETGNRGCTSNCLISGQLENPSDKTDKFDNGSILSDIYSWVNKNMFEIFD